ncbi:MAG: methyltransferase domain-containing protein [Planctomycetota bacterium]
MKVAVLVVSRNRPDLVERMADSLRRNMSIDHDLFVVEAGTDDDKLTEHTTAVYDDREFRGKCYAHNIALEIARKAGKEGTPYDYYWVLMNDVVFDEGVDAARLLIDQMEAEPRLAILSPTCKDRAYPGSDRRAGGGWRPVTTCDYLGFMMRAEAVETVGFLNPDFKYCWGAIHELSFLLYRNGWMVGYSDAVEYEHLGGSTYGAKGTNTISREEYQIRAKRFALTYFHTVYGPNWAQAFWDAARPHGIEHDTFSAHERLWSEAFTAQELAELRATCDTHAMSNAARSNASASALPEGDGAPLHRLHLGCGPDRKEGWVNVDVNPQFQPDLVSSAHDLPMLADGSCEVIEAYHLFEHFTLKQARAALREWRRLLAPGGELRLELPNLTRCIELIGTDMGGHDLGMISLFGFPPEVDEQGEPQLHKWGWTPETLKAAMQEAGFDRVEEAPITQTWRKAAKYDRDMRIVGAVAGVNAEAAAPSAGPAPDAKAVIAWPDYRDAAEIDRFMDTFGRALSARDDALLFLRIDPELDPDREGALDAIEASHVRVLGAEAELNVQLLEGPIQPSEWQEVGRSIACRIQLPSEVGPRDAARMAPAVVAEDVATLERALAVAGERTDASADRSLQTA